MNKIISNIKYIPNKEEGNWFIWFTVWNNKHYCVFWECSKPIWKIPRFEKGEKYIRMGWLLFSFGFGKH